MQLFGFIIRMKPIVIKYRSAGTETEQGQGHGQGQGQHSGYSDKARGRKPEESWFLSR